mgnify:CR=1 FL=1
MILKDVRVLDLTRLLPGPYCTWILSRFGAEVLKVEDTMMGDYVRGTPLYELINGGKKSLSINLKVDSGREILLELTKRYDVLVESFRPGVMDKLGLGYETLKEYNKKIIYCSISGYGQDGPYRDLPGHDLNYISISGLLGINRTKESPMIPGIPIADLGGGIFGALSIVASLYKREINGEGEYIDVSMMDVVNSFFNVVYQGLAAEALGGSLPFYNIYKAGDGEFLSLGAIEDKFWREFCLGIDREDLIDRQFDISVIEDLEKIFLEKTRDEWVEIFKEANTMLTPVYSPEEVPNDPQIRHRKVFDFEKKILNFPVKLHESETEKGGKAPDRGENTSEILRELGYKDKEIEDLKGDDVIY